MEFLKLLRYPGRFIVFGKDNDAFVAIYGATGRSDSSLHRRYEKRGDDIIAVQLQAGGNPELLTYPAMRFLDNTIIVANGRQIEKVRKDLQTDLAQEMFEPDTNKTPRITGLYTEAQHQAFAELHIVRTHGDDVERRCWDVALVSGEGKYIATYVGDDASPTPSFSGEPVSIQLNFGSSERAATAVFDSLMPPMGEKDYRVGVIACYKGYGLLAECTILNRMDLL